MQCDHDKNPHIPHMTKFFNKFNTWQKTFDFKRGKYKNHRFTAGKQCNSMNILVVYEVDQTFTFTLLYNSRESIPIPHQT